MTAISKAGWCQRCGLPYTTPSRPTCECASDRPVHYDGSPEPNFHPDMRTYLRRVRVLRYAPSAAEIARLTR
ncbi:hypothetical protein GBQ13_00360 [Mycobacterium avium subsp. hominissuis]|nr:hypothetical protein [Mycobacterium avium subsp. hominissuis]